MQIYCDFSGYSDIAIGCARLFGFDLKRNFNFPYFSRSIPEFWRRWHISLTTWFRDYIYFPLGGSRCSKWKIIRNVFIVWAVSGLWHGAAMHYVIWGGLNGLYQIIGEVLKPVRSWFSNCLKIEEKSFGNKVLHFFCTFVLVDISWIFFRSCFKYFYL